MIDRIRQVDLADESGMTLVELTVAIAAGLVVMAAVTLAMLTTVRETGRVTDHVEANQRAHLAMTMINSDLQSACTSEAAVPIQVGSNGSVLIFTHAVEAGLEENKEPAVLPVPVKSKIELSGTSLIQNNYAGTYNKATAEITYSATPSTGSPETLMKGISPLAAGGPVFTYYRYSGPTISETPMGEISTAALASEVARVGVSFKAAPAQSIQGDTNAATEIRNSVLLRNNAPTYNAIGNGPCT